MTPERWKKLDALFHEALELQGEARAAHLAKVCGDDAQLRAEVEKLIAAHERESSFIDSPIFAEAAALSDDGDESPVGRRWLSFKPRGPALFRTPVGCESDGGLEKATIDSAHSKNTSAKG
jgi:hypothetical protein